MGIHSSKIKKIKPKTINDLQKCIDVNFTPEEIQEWYIVYRTQLKDGNTGMHQEDFEQVYGSLFDGEAKGFADHVFRTFDTNNDGVVDFKEFLIGISLTGDEDFEKKLGWAFALYDVDGDGEITKEEMTGIIKAILQMNEKTGDNAESRSKDMVDGFFEEADFDKNGVVTHDEFMKAAWSMPIIVDILQCAPE